MSQNSKSKKHCLILDDFKDKLLYKTVLADGIKVPVDIDNMYLKLYEDCPDDYKEFICLFSPKVKYSI
jgi:hypothetical protein